jgi:hypothetical protein
VRRVTAWREEAVFVFIVRPFGRKRSAKGVEVDYDEVDRTLIQPALATLPEVTGRTAAAVVEAGNIRTDMFRQLVTADLVVADVSIHNANVFYELGIRHALRRGRTFLLRHEGDDIPFDLKTDRYLTYDAGDPAASVQRLAEALRATIDGRRADSPIFLLLPELGEQDVTALQEVRPPSRSPCCWPAGRDTWATSRSSGRSAAASPGRAARCASSARRSSSGGRTRGRARPGRR